eukprot:6468732-Amphidinium_carterae.1
MSTRQLYKPTLSLYALPADREMTQIEVHHELLLHRYAEQERCVALKHGDTHQTIASPKSYGCIPDAQTFRFSSYAFCSPCFAIRSDCLQAKTVQFLFKL